MKHMFSGFNLIGAIALLALASGCAGTQTQTKENLLIAAGFKVIVPHTAAQQQKLKALPAGKVTLVQKDRKTYYVFPDAANNQAYIGGSTQYQAYKQLRLANKLANENLEAAELNQDASMDWGGWGGWGGPGWERLR
jgi:hypothetical protein